MSRKNRKTNNNLTSRRDWTRGKFSDQIRTSQCSALAFGLCWREWFDNFSICWQNVFWCWVAFQLVIFFIFPFLFWFDILLFHLTPLSADSKIQKLKSLFFSLSFFSFVRRLWRDILKNTYTYCYTAVRTVRYTACFALLICHGRWIINHNAVFVPTVTYMWNEKKSQWKYKQPNERK